MSSLSINASMVRAHADLLDFGMALRNTKNPAMQARGVATYRRLKQRAEELAIKLTDRDRNELMGAAHLEVALRTHNRIEAAKLRRERLGEIKEMREEIEFSR